MDNNDAVRRASRLLESEEMKMKVQIKETNAPEELFYVFNGVNCAQDIIGNHGALNDGQFDRIEDQDIYLCDHETYKWWANYFTAQSSLDARLEHLKAEHGSDAVWAVISSSNYGYNDLEDQPATINAALDEEFGKQ